MATKGSTSAHRGRGRERLILLLRRTHLLLGWCNHFPPEGRAPAGGPKGLRRRRKPKMGTLSIQSAP